MNDRGLRLALVAAARRLSSLGMNTGKSGNLSGRVEGGFVITPSGKSYDSLGGNDMVHIDAHGEARGAHEPSSEWRLHRDIYERFPEAHAVVHTHSPFATTLSCLRRAAHRGRRRAPCRCRPVSRSSCRLA